MTNPQKSGTEDAKEVGKSTLRGKYEEGKSYPVRMDRKPPLWWMLTSRRSQTWDWDENGVTEVIGTHKESWKHAWLLVRYSSRFYIWWHYHAWAKFAWTKLDCGCTRNRFTRKFPLSSMNCEDHGIGKLFKDYGVEA